MNAKAILLAVCCACVVSAVALALPAPTNFTATVGDTNVVFDWDDVPGATKYSVDVCATVTYNDGADHETVVRLCYGTSDRTDGGLMGDSNLSVPKAKIIDDVKALLGVDPTTIVSLTINASAKVKALNPGKGAGRQDNPFSNPAGFVLTWTAP